MRCQVSHGFNATDTDIYAYDLIVRFLAVRQGYPYAREDFIFLRRHECAPFYSLVRTCSPVRSSLFDVIGHTNRSGLLGGFMFHTRFRVSIFYLCAAIDIRNATGIISSSISVTSSQFSTLPSSGFSLQARRYLLLATAFRMDLWLVQSSLGETVSFSMTRIKSRLYLSISTPHFRLR
jgi:hypothetical protein